VTHEAGDGIDARRGQLAVRVSLGALRLERPRPGAAALVDPRVARQAEAVRLEALARLVARGALVELEEDLLGQVLRAPEGGAALAKESHQGSSAGAHELLEWPRITGAQRQQRVLRPGRARCARCQGGARHQPPPPTSAGPRGFIRRMLPRAKGWATR